MGYSLKCVAHEALALIPFLYAALYPYLKGRSSIEYSWHAWSEWNTDIVSHHRFVALDKAALKLILLFAKRHLVCHPQFD
jgi:hypothetical protein